ncbi:Ferrochelatase, partial [Trichostrongylus colubriformis]
MIHGYGRIVTQSLWNELRKTATYERRRRVCTDVIKGKTHVLFLHMGLPRTEFYAKGFLRKSANVYYQIPKKLERYIPMPFLVNGRVRDAIAKYGEAGCIEEPLAAFTNRIQGSLNSIMPEFGTISCSSAFLFEEPSVEEELVNTGKNGYNHLVVFPLYPHFSCAHSGFLLNEVERVLQTLTIPATVDGREVLCERIVPKSSSSFHVSTLHRWSNHPVVSEYWLDILQSHRDSIGDVVFCAPSLRGYNSKTYCRSIWSTCDRIMAGLDDSYPWRLSFFNSWDQWNLPLRDSIKAQTKRLATHISPEKRIALVPVTSIIPDFNTFSVVPNIVASMVSVHRKLL